MLDVPGAVVDQHLEQRQDLFFGVTGEMSNESILLNLVTWTSQDIISTHPVTSIHDHTCKVH